MSLCVIVPVKRLSIAKTRLSCLLPQHIREKLVIEMLKCVLEAAKSSSVVSCTLVVSPDDKVIKIAREEGVLCLKDEGRGLNEAVKMALEWCVKREFKRALVVLGDTPLIETSDIEAMVAAATNPPAVILAPSKRWGTNCMLLYPPDIIKPSYGPGSFWRHLELAKRAGAKTGIYSSERTRLDVDEPEDLAELLSFKAMYRKLHAMLKSARIQGKPWDSF